MQMVLVDDANAYPVSVKIGEGVAETKNAVLSGNGNRTMTLDLSTWIKEQQTNNKGAQLQ